MSSQVSQAASNKRPKLHPLRQTSFPANGNAPVYPGASARSETGSIANSAFSTMSNNTKAPPRGRGRPRKSLQVTDEDVRSARDGGSTTGRGTKGDSQNKSVVSAARSNGGRHEDEEPEDEDEEEEEALEGDDLQANEQKRMDEKINVLQAQLTQAQSDRWSSLRGAALSSKAVKRIVNQTVSQSVTEICVKYVQWASKAFATEIVERAREVQAECAAAMEVSVEREKEAKLRTLKEKEKELETKEQKEKPDEGSAGLSEQDRQAIQTEIKRLRKEAEAYIPNKHKGGLLPDHLREALRRYKADGDGGGFGFDGLSHPLLGVQGAAAWRLGEGATGQRLFR